MNNAGTMAEMIEAAMKKKDGPKDSFTMNGSKASPVQRDEDREFVIYQSPNGEEIQVYGNWNEYAVDRTEEGNDLISDDDFPIIRNEEGEYIMDEAAYEEMLVQREQESRNMEEEVMPEEEEMPEESEEGEMKYGGKMMYAEGGRLSSEKAKPKPASPGQSYQHFKTLYENLLEEKRNNSDNWTTKDNLKLTMAYDNMRRTMRKAREEQMRQNPPTFMGGGMMYEDGGKLSSEKPKPKSASPSQAYQIFKTEYENLREEKRNSQNWTTKDNLQLQLAYDNMLRNQKIMREQQMKENSSTFMGGGMMPMKKRY